MKTVFIYLSVLLVSAILFSGCHKTKENKIIYYSDNDTIDLNIIADTITYDVLIKHPDLVDPVTAGFIKYLNKNSFIDGIFSSVYSGKLIAYNYYTNEPLSIDDIKSIEQKNGFNRDNIGKVQFKEIWYSSPNYSVFKKKVLSIVLGEEQYNSDSSLRGYLPVFRINMK